MAENNNDISKSKISDFGVKINYANYLELPPDERHEWPDRRLRDHEIILVLDGEFELSTPETGEVIRQKPHDIITIYPDELHTYKLLSKGKAAFFSCIHLEFDDAANAPRLPRHVAVRARHKMIPELFKRLNEEYHTPGHFQAEISESILKEIILRMLAAAGDRAVADSEELIMQMLDYLDRNLAKHYGRRELMQKFHLTGPYINQLFRQKVNLTPTQYLHRQLAYRGYELLCFRHHSVKEAAAVLGFANAFHFSKVFKKIFGLPPRTVTSLQTGAFRR